MQKLTYLACPYSHESRRLRQERFEAANLAAGYLMRAGHVVFSPISHTHPIVEACDLPKGWDYWREFDEAYLQCAGKLVVLTISGWQHSIGVSAEIAIAREIGLSIYKLDALVDGEYFMHQFEE